MALKKQSLKGSSPSIPWLQGETCHFVCTFMLAYTKYHFVLKFTVKNNAELLSFPVCPSTAARLVSSGFCKRMLENGTEIGVGGGGGLFCKAEWRSEQTEGTHFVVHASSFSPVNPLALTQLPLRAGPSDSISICLNYKDPHPLFSQPRNHIHTRNTLPTGVIHAAWGGHGRLWVGSINLMVHTHQRSCAHVQPHHRWGPPYLPSPTEGHPAANEDTQTPLTISTTLA